MISSLALLLLGLTAVCLTAALFWPERGAYWRWRRTRRLTQRVLREDALKAIYKAEMKGERPSLATVAGTLQVSRDQTSVLLTEMQTEGYVQLDSGRFRLTPQGRTAALHIIRAHRLWEHHLAEQTGVTELEWHDQAEQAEHLLTAAELDDLAQQLGYPTYDPHGDPIPSASGEFAAHQSQSLTQLQPDQAGRIVHIEDEPEIVYAQLVAAGLYPGMLVRVIEAAPDRIRFWANGDEQTLAPMLAANISVVTMATAVAAEPENTWALSELAPGAAGEVVAISPRCRGQERRRFMDLGILRGTHITAELRSPAHDPVAYRIRGALIALRREQADMIRMRSVPDG